MPAEIVSDSSVGFGQIFPGSNPACEVDEHSAQAVKNDNKGAGAAVVRRVLTPDIRRLMSIILI
jgi:hypothetical protein